ncbi:MAG: hypothetical protein ABSD80_00240 [Caulobacteraceae bacterium]
MIKLILGRVGVALAAAAILATSASVIVIALAFALFAFVRPYVGPAGAGAVVAGAAALLILLVGLTVLLLAPKPKPIRVSPRGNDPVERILNFFRDVPVTAVIAAVATGIIAVRNPKFLGAAARSFLEGDDRGRRRR